MIRLVKIPRLSNLYLRESFFSFDSVFNDRVFDGFQSTYRMSKTVITKIKLNWRFVWLDKLADIRDNAYNRRHNDLIDPVYKILS